MDNQNKNSPSCAEWSGTQADVISFEGGSRCRVQSGVNRALSQLKIECVRNGHAALYTELLPMIFVDETLAACQASAARLGMTTVSVMTAIQRIRARAKVLIREELRQSDSENDARWITDAPVSPIAFGL